MYCLDISKESKSSCGKEMDAARLLRSLGANGRLTGYHYLVRIINDMLRNPDEHFFLTKCIYPDTAKIFKVNPPSVEHAIRTAIRACWSYADHSALDYVAGRHLDRMPTNSEFIDMLVAFLQYMKTIE